MVALGAAGTIGELATLAIVLWMVFRVVRKAGFRRPQAWKTVAISLLLAVTGDLVGNYLGIALDWASHARNFTIPELAAYTAVSFVLSPFTLGIVPLLYYSFRRWPVEIRASDADVFE